MKEQLAINFGKYLFGPKTPFHWKKWFLWCLGQFFRCFEWKYCAVSENLFFLCLLCIYTSLLLWIDWVMFKTRLAKGPIPELADWTGFLRDWFRSLYFALPCWIPKDWIKNISVRLGTYINIDKSALDQTVVWSYWITHQCFGGQSLKEAELDCCQWLYS